MRRLSPRTKGTRFSLCELFSHRITVELFAANVNFRDSPRVFDVLERIGIENNKVGTLPCRDHPKLAGPNDLRRSFCSSRDDLVRSHTGLNHICELRMDRPSYRRSGIGAEADRRDVRIVDPFQIPSLNREEADGFGSVTRLAIRNLITQLLYLVCRQSFSDQWNVIGLNRPVR